ncbi:MAG: hypothetical protein H6737_23225 [Alphaproteobacteria bacterium]|nr:hypothetical protein [Alphaproteobacteria bacterium]
MSGKDTRLASASEPAVDKPKAPEPLGPVLQPDGNAAKQDTLGPGPWAPDLLGPSLPGLDEGFLGIDLAMPGPVVSPSVTPPAAPAAPAGPTQEEIAAQEKAREEAQLRSDRLLARNTFAELDDAMGIGVFDIKDTATAQRLLAGKTPQQMREIRAYYETRTGRKLEDDVAGQFGGKAGNEMMANVLSGMDLKDKIAHYDTSKSMENLLTHASEEEIAALTNGGKDRSVLTTLKDKMEPDAYMKARIQLFPAEAKQAVRERIESANGYLNDDEGAAMTAFASLPMTDRREMLKTYPHMFDYMSAEEQARARAIATSESAALSARMTQATKGGGTDDDAVKDIVRDAGRLNAEEKRLREQIAKGGLSDADKAKAQARLDELGNVSNLLTPKRNEDGSLVDGTFLGRLDGDVKDGEMHAYMEQMGMPAREVSKQRILDAVGFFNDDEKAIREAFAKVPVADRMALYLDDQVNNAMTEHLNDEELAEVRAFRDNNILEMSKTRIEEGNGFFAQDEAHILKSVMDMNEADRQKFASTSLYETTRARMDPLERKAFDEAMATGSISLETGMKAASGYDWDGTNTELMDLVSSTKSTAETLEIRQGYVLARDGVEPSTPEEKAALEKYRRVESLFQRELGHDDEQAQIDKLVAHDGPREDAYAGPGVTPMGPQLPTSEELERSTEAGRMTASKLIDHRGDDKMGEDGDGGGGLASWFSDTDQTAIQSHQTQKAAHLDAIRDGVVSEQELDGHTAMGKTFAEDYEKMLEAQEAITDAAKTGASLVAVSLLTLASSGTLGPAAAAWMSTYGFATTATTLATTSVLTGEVMGGDRYDATGVDGATDVATSFMNAGAGRVSSKLGELAQAKLAARFPGIFATPTEGLTGAALREAPLTTMRQQLPGLAVKNTVDNVSQSAMVSVGENLITKDFYEQSIGGMVQELGSDAVDSAKGGLRDAIVGTVVDSGVTAWQSKRLNGFMSNLEQRGFEPEALDKMTFGTLDQLGRAQQMLDAGDVVKARELIEALDLTPEHQSMMFDSMRDNLPAVDPEAASIAPKLETPTVETPTVEAPKVEAPTPELEQALTPEIQAALDPANQAKSNLEIPDAKVDVTPAERLADAQTRAEKIIMGGSDEAMAEYLLDNFEDAAKLESVLDTHALDLGGDKAPLGAASGKTYPLIHPETGEEIGFVRGDTKIFRFEPKDVDTPMTPHESPYFDDIGTHRAGFGADQALFVADSPEAVADLEQLRLSQGYFEDPNIVMRSTTYDELLAAYPDAKIMTDAKMEFGRGIEGARVISVNSGNATGESIRFEDHAMDEISSVIESLPPSGTVRADADLIKAFKGFEPGEFGSIPQGPDGFSLDGVPEYLKEMKDFGMYRNEAGEVFVVRGEIPADAVEVLVEPSK